MKSEEIHINDIMRILLGNTPGIFLIEVLMRIAFLILLLVVAIRLMGKRMSSQLSIQEMAMLVILAGAIGIPMQTPERGLLPPVIIAVLAILSQRIIGKMSFKDKKVEYITQGDADVIIQDGTLVLKNLKKNGLSREMVLAQVRSFKLRSLGMVKRLYMEANGSFSLVQEDDLKPGLSVIPFSDTNLLDKQKKSENMISCCSCGLTIDKNKLHKDQCPVCTSSNWISSVE